MESSRLLSPRLESVLAALQPCRLLADVGTDHGLVPVAAVLRGLAERAIAADLRAPPLAGASRWIQRCDVTDRVSVLQGDGIAALHPRPVDAVVMAGMSGTLMARLCSLAPQVLRGVKQLVLQPNSGMATLRRWALANGWHLRHEEMLEERSRFFTVCVFHPGQGDDVSYTHRSFSREQLLMLGPRLLAARDPIAARWYTAQRMRIAKLTQRAPALEAELATWTAAVDELASET